MGTGKMSEQERVLAALQESRAQTTSLRHALRRYELVLGRVSRQVEQGALVHEMMRKIGVSELRADLVDRLTRFEEARHTMRVACFQLSHTEGLSIAEIARLWGISRQLASRLVNEAVDDPVPSRRQSA
jgi:hypothetical protein